ACSSRTRAGRRHPASSCRSRSSSMKPTSVSTPPGCPERSRPAASRPVSAGGRLGAGESRLAYHPPCQQEIEEIGGARAEAEQAERRQRRQGQQPAEAE